MPPALDRHVVTAVLVAHEGARWLPETLKALLTQTRPVQRFVAVDTGSTDRGPAVLTEVVGEGNLLRLPSATGYGEAVARALRHRAASLPVPDDGPGRPRSEWIWLLHDDSAPAADALERLLRAADADPGAAVLGPKLRDWEDRRLLLELGVTIDGAGRRETGVERLEFDQGQHDGVRAVLAVSTAGMLVRRDVWERLGGLDAAFGLFRDDVDFGWRAHAAGHRVLAVGDAVVYHAEASARGLRESGLPAVSPRRRDRRNALYVLLANLPLGPAVRALARNLLGTALRTLYLLAVKRQTAARDELAAFGDVLRAPGRLRRARAARAEGRRGSGRQVHRTVRRFQPRRVALRRLVERTAAALSAEGRHRGERDDAPPEGPGLLRRVLGHPSAVVALSLGVVTLAAERTVIAAGSRLGGGALVPAWGGASDLWEQYAAGWHPVGLGSAEQAPPSVGVLAALSTLAFGKPWLAVSVLLLGSVPLAGLTAYAAARALVAEPPRTGRRALRQGTGRRIPLPAVRVWIAVTYALLPVATGAIAGGRLGTAVVLVLLPLIVWQAARMYALPRWRPVPRKQRRRAAWAVALLLSVAMAFVPLVWLLALPAGVLLWAAFGSSRTRRVDRKLLVALGVPPLLLLPWTLGLLRHPARLLLETGLHPATGPAPGAVSLLALNPGGPGTPPPWVLYGLLLIAVLALPLRSRRPVVLIGWMLALSGLLAAVGVSAVTVTKGAERAAGWPGVALLVAAAGILLAATAAVLRSVDTLAGRDLPYRLGGGLVVLAALTAPVLAGLAWIAGGARDPLREVPAGAVPGFVGGPAGPRTLVLSRGDRGRVSYTVLRGAEPRLGDTETPAAEPARRRMDALVAALAAGHGDGPALTRMGVQYVLVPRPAQDPTTAVLDASPALTRLSRTDEFGIWRLPAPSGRLLLVQGTTVTPLPAGRVAASVRIPPGTGTRTLLLAEPADGGWRATLDGTQIPGRRVDDWAQAYDVPAGGGHFELHRSMRLRHIWVTVQGAAFLVVAVLALPGARAGAITVPGRTRRRPGARRARRAAKPSEPRRDPSASQPTPTAEPPATRERESPVTAGEHP
ncbi:Glycosyltransferase, GT2 family [Thermomonospora echinospora]|uniref:Glycosyltransferase, GT2 family n=1 Tax=Thermomonospora echinospora TaxID=1992 RepID=A0A1H5WDC4_9ACTN|nr:glycosyltransferase family 2 protein [Thermomonospora echinospora]SEF97191.1 Glycosyltransferase, GT2 family [Thermomonospora echinospora]